MKFQIGLLLSLVLLLAPSRALAGEYSLRDLADDLVKPGRRQGLTGRFDFAAGVVHTKAEHSSWTPTEWLSDDSGGGTIVGVGYGLTDRIMVNAGLRGLIHGEKALLSLILGPVAMLFADEHVVYGSSLCYYLREEAPSFFFEAGAGSGSIDNPFDEGVVHDAGTSGTSFFGGVGYEFAAHLQIQTHLVWTENSEDEQTRKGKWTATSAFLSFGVIGY